MVYYQEGRGGEGSHSAFLTMSQMAADDSWGRQGTKKDNAAEQWLQVIPFQELVQIRLAPATVGVKLVLKVS